MWGFGGSGSGRGFPSQFVAQYNCSSTAVAGRDVEEGDKIILPPSALDKLARMNVEYPMLFEITNNNGINKRTHCGVLEFSAEEGWCYMPFWMMQNLLMEEGGLVTVKNVSLSKATFIKLRAQSVDFLEVSNHRALLEVALRKFTCLTVGDTICIPYSGKKFYLDIREVQPNGCASIIETDCNVDFEEPLGYKDSKYAQYEKNKKDETNSVSSGGSHRSTPVGLPMAERVLQRATVTSPQEEAAAANVFKPFSGNAKRIDGKPPTSSSSSSTAGAPPKINNAAYYEAKMSGSTPSPDTTSTSSSPEPTAIAYQSRIGNKYSTKKTAVSAFSGTAHKLT